MPDRRLNEIRNAMRLSSHEDEAVSVGRMVDLWPFDTDKNRAVCNRAAEFVTKLRRERRPNLMERFLSQYGLNTDEGIALMCLAEAYLRTPDDETLDALISDKIGESNWSRHLGRAESALVNASTWALMLTGKVFRTIPAATGDMVTTMRAVVRRLGEPVARVAVGEAMKVLGQQFVLGRSIDEALDNAAEIGSEGYLHSFDMLGEAALTANDAKRYFLAYSDAISEIAKRAKAGNPHDNPGISVKLSALHPRYQSVHRARVLDELVPRVAALAEHAKAANIGLAIDAEEMDRLDLSLDIVEAVLANRDIKGWGGFGVVVQAYSKQTSFVLDWLYALTKKLDRRISVRLVKGAYWDSEIKLAQLLGLAGYPVFTRKAATDISYLVAARQLLSMTDRIYPQFATHNAHTAVAIEAMAAPDSVFEFQRLHGMGEGLHEILRQSDGRRRRIYAPVGVHRDLLAYLVRRLLENGANSSFVHQLLDNSVAATQIAADPMALIEADAYTPHPRIVLPQAIFADRINAAGWNLNVSHQREQLDAAMSPFRVHIWGAGAEPDGALKLYNPANRAKPVGTVNQDDTQSVQQAIGRAVNGFDSWSATSAEDRGQILERAANFYEENGAELMALAVREAGKTRSDAIAELREAVDFLRYYAGEARKLGNDRMPLGVIGCISPWNFPLAIFTGQVASALAAGNTVVAKPAEQTPLIAARAVELLHQAGVPAAALAIVIGDGAAIGPALTGDPRIAGIAFTGSNDTARLIDCSLAEAGNWDAPLVAETGGINAMIVDSTALLEQTVGDILLSAFQSAGQRCSALRVLYVQRDIAAALLEMLEGAVREMQIGDPWDPATDIGPVIDEAARAGIVRHCETFAARGRKLFQVDLPKECANGTFVAPTVLRLERISELEKEIFGPVLHVIEFEASDIDQVIADINATGFGLTFAIHSRIETRVNAICERIHAGNIYVNRNQIGAVVGVQPFGGEGLSGTGPKAGGPHTVTRFTTPEAGTLPSQRPVLLAGPTGERNSYTVLPRGAVICLGPGDGDFKLQQDLAAATGNRALVVRDAGELNRTLDHSAVDIVLYDGDDRGGLRRTLAKRTGRRVQLLRCDCDPVRLMKEKSISEDTTASGGNATLLAEAG